MNLKKITSSQNENTLFLKVPKDLFRKEAILKSCYKYLAIGDVSIHADDNNYIIQITAGENAGKPFLSIDQVSNDMIDFELREIIAIQTKSIRAAIIEKTFSK